MSEIPEGLCQCGCGQATKISPRNEKRSGAVKGRPFRFITGHNTKLWPDKPLRYEIDEETGCWLFQGTITDKGYGTIQRNRKTVGAHRASWEEVNGPIPNGLFVCHHCDNPPCINPAHLFLGTRKDNSDDRDAKGRNVNQRGESHPMAKLTARDIRAIRERVRAGERPQHVWLGSYRHIVSYEHLCKIARGASWMDQAECHQPTPHTAT